MHRITLSATLIASTMLALAPFPLMAQVGPAGTPVKPIVIKPLPKPHGGGLVPLPGTPLLRVHLADAADKSAYIHDIDGHGRPLTFRLGQRVVINGKGFDMRRPRSLVALFPAGQKGGITVTVVAWNDTQITAQMPLTQNFFPAGVSNAQLLVQVVRPNNDFVPLRVSGVRYDSAH